MKVNTGGGFQGVFDAELVGFFITLRSRGTNGRSFAGVEHTELDPSGICIQAHSTTERINFANHVPLC